jgi:hypothetical protein
VALLNCEPLHMTIISVIVMQSFPVAISLD